MSCLSGALARKSRSSNVYASNHACMTSCGNVRSTIHSSAPSISTRCPLFSTPFSISLLLYFSSHNSACSCWTHITESLLLLLLLVIIIIIHWLVCQYEATVPTIILKILWERLLRLRQGTRCMWCMWILKTTNNIFNYTVSSSLQETWWSPFPLPVPFPLPCTVRSRRKLLLVVYKLYYLTICATVCCHRTTAWSCPLLVAKDNGGALSSVGCCRATEPSFQVTTIQSRDISNLTKEGSYLLLFTTIWLSNLT